MLKRVNFIIGLCLVLNVIPIDNFAQQNQPNFIVIYSDDQRYDAMGANGNTVISTPALDNLADQGIRFKNAHVVFSLCSPSRAALLTGRYGSANGVLQLGSDLNPDEKTLAQILKENGYATALSGKWHLGKTPLEAGFDFSVWFEGNGTYYGRKIYDQNNIVIPQEHCDLYCARRSVDFLKSTKESNTPFFLFHNTQLPHMNGELKWDARPETLDNYKVGDMPVPATHLDSLSGKPFYLKNVRNFTQARVYGYPEKSAIQKHTQEYYAVITEMNDFLAELLNAVDELGFKKNTFIFFMSDNGWMLGEFGFTSKVLPYQPSTHVPLLISGPGIKPATDDRLVLNIDVFPTILELAGAPLSDNLHGKSLVPLIFNKKKNWRKAFVYEGLGTYGGAQPNLSVVTEDYKYIVTYDDLELKSTSFFELYDLAADPEERYNMAGNKQYQTQIQKFDKIIQNHFQVVFRKSK